MKNQTRIAAIVGAVGLAAVIGVVAVGATVGGAEEPETAARSANADRSAEPEASARPDAVTSFPGLEVADGEPWLASIDSASPAPGTVAEASGPFDDRFEFRDLAFDGTTVSGEVVITSDVSEVLDLEVISGFYDDQGKLVGDATFVLPVDAQHVHDESASAVPVESYAFEVTVPSDAGGTAVAAAVGIPVLVNE